MQPPALKTWSTLGASGPLDVEDDEPLLARRDVGIRPGQVDVVGVFQRQSGRSGSGVGGSVTSRTLIPSSSQT